MSIMTLADKTMFITGGSGASDLPLPNVPRATVRMWQSLPRRRAASQAGRHDSTPPQRRSRAAGGKALPILLDVRDAEAVEAAVKLTANHFGGIDICVNNASAINLSASEAIDIKRFDLIQQINVRGTFLVSRACVPYLRKSTNAHVLNLSPPLEMRADWFGQHLAYTMSKYGMSMVALGMAEEFRKDGIAFNGLWPMTTVATAAVEHALGGEEMMRRSRTPDIMADAAHAIFLRDAREFTGNFVLDEEVLREEGVTDFSGYRHDPQSDLQIDIFVDPETHHPA